MKIIECPRDAMQGLHAFIPTNKKAAYINQLMAVGFDTIDFGSFVSPKAVPQLKDTATIVDRIDKSISNTKLLAIVANKRGGDDACKFDQIDYLGFPFSISETFQKRNTNSTIEESFGTVGYLSELCNKTGKELVVYISMGFGNPYGDPWNSDIVINWVKQLSNFNIRIFSIADTVGLAKPDEINHIFTHLIPEFQHLEFGAHLHCRPDDWKLKVGAAFDSGCRRFDSAIMGFGGCPMAGDDLTGNLATEDLLSFLKDSNEAMPLNFQALQLSQTMASEIFPQI